MGFDRPHFAQPFRRGADGAPVAVEQDTQDEIQGCVFAIASCPLGFRPERPDFGWRWPTFQNAPIDLTSLQDAIALLEPRADDVTITQAAQDQGTVTEILGALVPSAGTIPGPTLLPSAGAITEVATGEPGAVEVAVDLQASGGAE